MPIARTGGASAAGVFFSEPYPSQDVLLAGSLVSIDTSNGTPEIILADPSNADRLLGFAVSGINIGDVGKYVVNRGALVTPIVAGGGALTPNDPVFAVANGEVSHTPPTTGFSVQVGFAISATQIILTTDFRVEF